MPDAFVVLATQTTSVLIDLNRVYVDGGLEARRTVREAERSDPELRVYCWFDEHFVRPATTSLAHRLIGRYVQRYQPGLFDRAPTEQP